MTRRRSQHHGVSEQKRARHIDGRNPASGLPRVTHEGQKITPRRMRDIIRERELTQEAADTWPLDDAE